MIVSSGFAANKNVLPLSIRLVNIKMRNSKWSFWLFLMSLIHFYFLPYYFEQKLSRIAIKIPVFIIIESNMNSSRFIFNQIQSVSDTWIIIILSCIFRFSSLASLKVQTFKGKHINRFRASQLNFMCCLLIKEKMSSQQRLYYLQLWRD